MHHVDLSEAQLCADRIDDGHAVMERVIRALDAAGVPWHRRRWELRTLTTEANALRGGDRRTYTPDERAARIRELEARIRELEAQIASDGARAVWERAEHEGR